MQLSEWSFMYTHYHWSYKKCYISSEATDFYDNNLHQLAYCIDSNDLEITSRRNYTKGRLKYDSNHREKPV